MTGKTAELHELKIPEVDIKVEVQDDGVVWITIGGEIISVETLGKIVNFTEKHGEVRVGR